MNKSDSIKELATALAKAQLELKNPAFDSKNPHFKSSYASLASVRDAIIPVFSRHGLSIIQNVSSGENGVSCSNLIMHTSGEWLESDNLDIPADKHNAHGYGSACTYARRFSLMAIATVVGDIDDDGNSATIGNVENKGKGQITPTSGLWDELSDDEKSFLEKIAVEVIALINSGDICAAVEHLNGKQLDTEEKAAIWTRFDSKQRAGMKKEFARVEALKSESLIKLSD